MNLTIRSAEVAENKYAYTQSAEGQVQSGCIGHLRVDMGWDGKGFYTSWDNHADGLNTPEFRDEFQQVINELRRGMLKDRASLRKYCSSRAEAAMPEANDSFCFRADTKDHSYILRLNTVEGNYAAYCYCYRREDLDRALKPVVAEKNDKVVNYQIFQLKDTPENADIRFVNLASLERLGKDVNLDNYKCVWMGQMPMGTDLEDIFCKFNLEKPSGFGGHSMSVSDIIVTYDPEVTKAWFVDTFGFKQLPDHVLRGHLVTDEKPLPEVYRHTLQYAKSAGEVEAFRTSHNENVRCAKAIDKAISAHFDGMHLNTSCVKPLFQQFGTDRMEWVLANTLMLKDHDGRFSRSNKEWAATVEVTMDTNGFGGVRNDDYLLESHPAVLDGFISAARKELTAQREAEAQKAAEEVVPEKMTVLVVEPGKKPYEKQIDPGLESLQKEVGGFIQAVYPFDDSVAVICDEEGKLNDKPLNRSLKDEEGRLYDIVAGTILVTGLGEEDFASLTPEQSKRYAKMFETPEKFVNLGGRFMVIPLEEKKDSLHDRLSAKKAIVAGEDKPKHGNKNRGGDAL